MVRGGAWSAVLGRRHRGDGWVRRIQLTIACVACLWAGFVGTVRAGGLEFSGAGVHGLSRGGAVAARTNDAMALRYNPAGLVEVHGSQVIMEMQLSLLDACVDPIGYYGWGVYRGGESFELPDPQGGQPRPTTLEVGSQYYRDTLDRVCLSQNVQPVPQLAWAKALTRRWGIGAGLIFPAAMPSGSWGGKDGVIRNDDGELRPAPTRYQQISSGNLALFPTLGAGYRATDWLRLGVSLTAGVYLIDTEVMRVSGGGTGPAADIIVRLDAQDWFVPGATASAHFVPFDALDIVTAFRWQGFIDASGTATATTGAFNPLFARQDTELEIDSVRQNLPWAATLALRYASRRGPRGDTVDPMVDENWDIELDVQYQLNSRGDTQVVDPADGQQLVFRDAQAANLAPEEQEDFTTLAEFPNWTSLPKGWVDQWSVRLGGSYQVLPGKLSASLGAHLETRGVEPGLAQVDFMPFARAGVHAGLTVRVDDWIDLRAGYAYIRQETLTVRPPPHQDRSEGGFDKTVGNPGEGRLGDDGDEEVLQEQPPVTTANGTAALTQQVVRTSEADPPYIINAGTYRSQMHVLSVGARLRF